MPIHTSHTHFRSELRVSSFRIGLNKASILTSKTTLQQKQSFRFLHSRLFQIELCRYRPLFLSIFTLRHTHTHTISIGSTHTQIDVYFPIPFCHHVFLLPQRRIVSAKHVALPWTSRGYFCWASVMELPK